MTAPDEVSRARAIVVPNGTARRRPFHPVVTHVVATTVAGFLYYATAIPGLAWGDSGNAQVRVLTGMYHDPDDPSRSHIPFYVLASALNSLGVAPHRAATLLSAFAGAVTIGNVACLLTLVTHTRRAVVAGTLLSMFSHAIWSLSTVPEVMTLSSALFTLELVAVVQYLHHRRPAFLCLAFFINGLGAGTHNMAMLIWPAYAILLYFLIHSQFPISGRTIVAGAVAWVMGAAPLIWLLAKTSTSSGSLFAALHDMLVGRFAFAVFNTGSLSRLVLRAVAYAAYSCPTPLIVCAVTGCVRLWNGADRRMTSFFCTALFFHGLFVARYNVPDQHTFMVPTMILLMVLAAAGIDGLCAVCRARVLPTLALLALACPAVLTYSVAPRLLRRYDLEATVVPTRPIPHRDPIDWFLKPWRNGDDGAERFAREVLREVPPDVVLAVDSTLMPPILYLQIDEKLRRDVHIVSAGTYQPWLSTEFTLSDAAVRKDVIAAGRLYSGTDFPGALNPHLRDPHLAFIPRGSVFQVVFASPGDSDGDSSP